MVSIETPPAPSIYSEIPNKHAGDSLGVSVPGSFDVFCSLAAWHSAHLDIAGEVTNGPAAYAIQSIASAYADRLSQPEVHSLTCFSGQGAPEEASSEALLEDLHAYVGRTGATGLIVVRGLDASRATVQQYSAVGEYLLEHMNQRDHAAVLTCGYKKPLPRNTDKGFVSASQLASAARQEFLLQADGMIWGRTAG